MTPGLIVSAVTLVVATAAGFMWLARNGRIRPQPGTAITADAPETPVLSESDLGAALGDRATLVQFSTAFCAPCRATRRILGDVAGMVDGVRHIEVDAESRLDLVRRLDILRTPTTLVLDHLGNVTHRASGQPRKADVIAALGVVIVPPETVIVPPETTQVSSGSTDAQG